MVGDKAGINFKYNFSLMGGDMDQEIRSIAYIKAFIHISLLTTIFWVILNICSNAKCFATEVEIFDAASFPKEFEGMGQIDQLDGDYVVINDQRFKLAADIRYNTRTMQNVTSTSFTEGLSVGFLTDNKGRIFSLWLLD